MNQNYEDVLDFTYKKNEYLGLVFIKPNINIIITFPDHLTCQGYFNDMEDRHSYNYMKKYYTKPLASMEDDDYFNVKKIIEPKINHKFNFQISDELASKFNDLISKTVDYCRKNGIIQNEFFEEVTNYYYKNSVTFKTKVGTLIKDVPNIRVRDKVTLTVRYVGAVYYNGILNNKWEIVEVNDIIKY